MRKAENSNKEHKEQIQTKISAAIFIKANKTCLKGVGVVIFISSYSVFY